MLGILRGEVEAIGCMAEDLGREGGTTTTTTTTTTGYYGREIVEMIRGRQGETDRAVARWGGGGVVL